MLEWIRKYKTAIAFIIGVITGSIGAYYKVMSRLDTMEFKVDIIREEAKKEYNNIYEIFHLYNKRIKSFGD